MNKQSRNQERIDQKLNAIHDYIQSIPAAPAFTVPSLCSTPREAEEETEQIIMMMASPLPETRAKANYLQCMEVLGFPVTTSIEDVSLHNLVYRNTVEPLYYDQIWANYVKSKV